MVAVALALRTPGQVMSWVNVTVSLMNLMALTSLRRAAARRWYEKHAA